MTNLTRPHSHDPNPQPPSDDPAFYLAWPGSKIELTLDEIRRLPHSVVTDCYIVSTGHGTSGPFTFAGTKLQSMIKAFTDTEWREVWVASADGFGTTLTVEEIENVGSRPVLLAYEIDGRAMSREEGLVRLIVPSEVDDALRQIKWVGEILLIP